MPALELLHVFGADLLPARAWALVDWRHARGASEFTIAGLVTEGSTTALLAPFDEATAPYKLAPSARRHLSGPPDTGLVFPTDLWQLNPATLAALRLAFPRGPFDYFPADAWFENLEMYRDGELMLGIITHEHEGVVRVTSEEQAILGQLGFAYRLAGEWVGY